MQPGAADLQGLAGGLGDHDVQAAAGAHLRDARAHLATAHNSDAFDVGHIVPFASLYCRPRRVPRVIPAPAFGP
ncbi:hypothetical protein GCM10010326_47280 [Streptomyces xanthochromogenes]|uniref:Uncharacterized protein n=1 Tax=Streptomyces xanthochromogenes TaxID=67384 RepID=A0ABQ3AG48_9ACTN|nr:hypothetical protein GCM10010326_47280 [Streptomyces xanthochromogenes]